jgi:hypothetical protein
MSNVNVKSRELRLTDTQLIALSMASQREDGAVSFPERIKGAAAVNLAASLLAKGLVVEVDAAASMPPARQDEGGRRFALVITELGRSSINVAEETSDDGEQGRGDVLESQENAASDFGQATEVPASCPGAADAQLRPTAAIEEAPIGEENAGRPDTSTTPAAMPREGSKLANVIGLLCRPDGASMDEIVDVTTWLPHTARAALTGLRKRGFNIERTRADGVTRYRIVADDAGGDAIPHRPDASASSTPIEGSTEAA